MKRGGDGIDYVRKTVDKADILQTLRVLEARAERLVRRADDAWTRSRSDELHAHAAGLRAAIDMVEHRLGLLEAHPSRGWENVTGGGRY